MLLFFYSPLLCSITSVSCFPFVMSLVLFFTSLIFQIVLCSFTSQVTESFLQRGTKIRVGGMQTMCTLSIVNCQFRSIYINRMEEELPAEGSKLMPGNFVNCKLVYRKRRKHLATWT